MKELRYEETVIDDVRLTCTQFMAMKNFSLFAKLMRTIGPAVATLGASKGDADVMKVLPMALRDVEPGDLTALALEVLAGTTANVDGANFSLSTSSAIDAVFSGRSLMTLIKAIAFAVKVNFSDFFDEAAVGGPAEAKPASA